MKQEQCRPGWVPKAAHVELQKAADTSVKSKQVGGRERGKLFPGERNFKKEREEWVGRNWWWGEFWIRMETRGKKKGIWGTADRYVNIESGRWRRKNFKHILQCIENILWPHQTTHAMHTLPLEVLKRVSINCSCFQLYFSVRLNIPRIGSVQRLVIWDPS